MTEPGTPQIQEDPLSPPVVPRKSRRRLWTWIGLGLWLGSMVGGVFVVRILWQQGQADRTAERARFANVAEQEKRDQGIDDLLGRRRQAILKHQRAQWLATIDPSSKALIAQQGKVFDNLQVVPLAEWTYSLNGKPVSGAGGTTASAAVTQGHRIAGFDDAQVLTEQSLTLVRKGDVWLVKSIAPTTAQPWDFGTLRKYQGKSSIVLGTASAARLQEVAGQADAGVQTVSAVWGTGWARKAVILMPATESEFGKLGRYDGEAVDQVSGVTLGSTTSTDRVVLNPRYINGKNLQEQKEIIAHEITHVATDVRASEATPTWLSEGFAEYVSIDATEIDPEVGGEIVWEAIQAGRLSTSLPAESVFRSKNADVAYLQGWVAVSLLAEVYGEAKVVAFYREVAAPHSAKITPEIWLAQAWKSKLGTTQAAFTARLKSYLQRAGS